MIIQGVPIAYCANIIEQYIADRKGVRIQVQLPIQQKDEEKFIKALNITCAYFNIQL